MTTMTRRGFLKLMGLGAAACALGGLPARAGQPAARKPNFVILFADDQGYQDLGCFGSPLIRTPNLDRMAAEGMRFTDFYTAACVCTPSRAALMTGCYPSRVGLPQVLGSRARIGLSDKEVTIAGLLKNQGYATVCIGKWHLGHHPEFLPTRHGFDSYFGIPFSNDMSHDRSMKLAQNITLREGWTLERVRNEQPQANVVPLLRDEEVVEYPADQATLTRRYTEEALKFISANQDRPFLLYLPYTMPHEPLHASEVFSGKSPRGLYGDVIEEIDWSVGRILEELRRRGLAENTLVFYSSDNGPWLIKGKDGGCALPLRDGKSTTYEGGMREPTLMWWPGTIPAGSVCRELASTIDMLPTIAALAGTRPPQDRVIDGRNILPLMKREPGAKSPHEAFYYYRCDLTILRLEAVRCGKWKLRQANEKSPLELYNLEADIGETTNLAEREPAVVARLKKMMADFDRELHANARPPGRLPPVTGAKAKKG